jgi:hypothetical protein
VPRDFAVMKATDVFKEKDCFEWALSIGLLDSDEEIHFTSRTPQIDNIDCPRMIHDLASKTYF